MESAIRIGRIGAVVDTTTWGLGITYDHRMEAMFGLKRVSLATISILCLHILIVIKEEPNNGN